MTNTVRNRKGNKPARDGGIWRGCGDKNCPWCITTRTNKKCKEYSKRDQL